MQKLIKVWSPESRPLNSWYRLLVTLQSPCTWFFEVSSQGVTWFFIALVPDSWWFKVLVPGYSSNLIGPRYPWITTSASSVRRLLNCFGSGKILHTSAELQPASWEYLFHKFLTKVCGCHSEVDIGSIMLPYYLADLHKLLFYANDSWCWYLWLMASSMTQKFANHNQCNLLI